jgi:hypothetical protein
MSAIAPYLVAFFAMSFSTLSALTLIYAVKHLEPPAGPALPPEVHVEEEVAISMAVRQTV